MPNYEADTQKALADIKDQEVESYKEKCMEYIKNGIDKGLEKTAKEAWATLAADRKQEYEETIQKLKLKNSKLKTRILKLGQAKTKSNKKSSKRGSGVKEESESSNSENNDSSSGSSSDDGGSSSSEESAEEEPKRRRRSKRLPTPRKKAPKRDRDSSRESDVQVIPPEPARKSSSSKRRRKEVSPAPSTSSKSGSVKDRLGGSSRGPVKVRLGTDEERKRARIMNTDILKLDDGDLYIRYEIKKLTHKCELKDCRKIQMERGYEAIDPRHPDHMAHRFHMSSIEQEEERKKREIKAPKK